MPAVLTQHSYGKSRIRLTKVTRLADRHEVRELTIEIELEGDFADSYTSGDNRLIIPTDTMKNVAYALAKEHPLESIEDFGAAVAGHFLEQSFPRRAGDRPPGRAAAGADPRRRPRASPRILRQELARREPAPSMRSRRGLRVESGLDDLFLLKIDRLGLLRVPARSLHDASGRLRPDPGHDAQGRLALHCRRRRLESVRTRAFARPCSRRSPATRASPCSRRSTPWARRRSTRAPRSSGSP